MAELPEILIYDKTMARVSAINSYSSFRWDHNYYDSDTFEIVANRYKQNVDELVDGGFIVYESPLGAAGNIIPAYNVGLLDFDNKLMDERGKSSEMWTVNGRGVESVLGNNQMAHAWGIGDGFDTQTGHAETSMRHYVTVEAISPTDTNRAISGITLATVDQQRGPELEYKARMPKYLNEVLMELGMQSGLSPKLVWTETGKNFVFTVFEGADLSSGIGKVILSVDFGNVKAYDYIYNALDYRNFVYIGGPGDGATRILESVYSGESEPTGWDRRETFVDATNELTTEERAVKGNQVLIERAATQTLDFTFDQTSRSFVLGTDFNLGDIVVVDFPDVATMTSRITRISEIYDVKKGRTFEIGVGTAAPDLISIIARNTKKIAGLQTR